MVGDGIQAKDNDKAVTDALGLDESPALVILTPDGDKVAYDGKVLKTLRRSIC